MNKTRKKTVNARKAGIDKKKSREELHIELESLFDFLSAEDIDEVLNLMLTLSLSHPEDMFDNVEKANLLLLVDDLIYLMYVLRDYYEAYVANEELEKAAV